MNNTEIFALISLIIDSLTLFCVIVGVVISIAQWQKKNSLQRSEYLEKLISGTRFNKDITETSYLIDYGGKWYDKSFHGGSELELKIDNTLSFYSYICYLKKEKIISEKEFKLFEYRITKIINSQQIQDYLYNLYHYSQKFSKQISTNNNVQISFIHLLEYGKEKGYIKDDFFDKASYRENLKYHKYLNF